MPAGLDKLQHIVVLMMENRSFDHMLGSLKAVNPTIDGVDADTFTNPDNNGNVVKPQPKAAFQAQLQPDPDHHFPAVDLQLYFGGDTGANRPAQDAGLRQELFQPAAVMRSIRTTIMYYFPQDKLPVLTTLALKLRGFQPLVRFDTRTDRSAIGCSLTTELHSDGWSGSIYPPGAIKHLHALTSASSQNEPTENLLLRHDQLHHGSRQPAAESARAFRNLQSVSCGLRERRSAALFVLSSRTTATTKAKAVKRSPPTSIPITTFKRAKSSSRPSTRRSRTIPTSGRALHCSSPMTNTAASSTTCRHRIAQRIFTADGNATGTGTPFHFDRLGVRVPTILISPWIPKGTVDNRVFDHASIPATITKFFLGDYSPRSPRETSADIFLEPQGSAIDPARNLLSLDVMRTDCPDFDV